MTELAPFELTSLALQFCSLEPGQMLTKSERNDVQRATELMQLYLMRTEIDRRYTLAEQAGALGVSVATIKRWANSDEYKRVAAFMAPPSRSPMVAEGRAFLQENLLPLALSSARTLLESDDTRASTKANLIKEILRFSMAEGPTESADVQRRDAMTWLKEQGVNIENINILVQSDVAPQDYMERLRDSMPVDGEVVESDSLDTHP